MDKFKFLERLTNRKFTLAVLALASVTLLTWAQRVTGDVYSFVVVSTVGAYLTANVLQKYGTAKTDASPSNPTETTQ